VSRQGGRGADDHGVGWPRTGARSGRGAAWTTSTGDGVQQCGWGERGERERERELGEEEREGVVVQFIENGREGERASGSSSGHQWCQRKEGVMGEGETTPLT
jgi:hypothetical protein